MSMDSKPLMAIAGGIAPDILYVNFRQSDTYIQQGFLYPLDKPEDGYLASMTEEEKAFRVHEKIWPVIKRRGPGATEHVWALPYGGTLGKVTLYRKDLFDAHKIPYPHNDWTWDDLWRICEELTDPVKGDYGLQLGRGNSESWFWVTFLWSAGADAIKYFPEDDQWRAVYDSDGAAEALDFYTRISSQPWHDAGGKKRYGLAYKESGGNQKWENGEIGMRFSYIDEKLFHTIDPDVTGMVPVPIGPGGHRGAELNSRMMGLYAGVEDPVVRDAAWEFLRFYDSRDAVKIRTRIMVEGGLGPFINPRYLEMFGYEDIIRLAPRGWKECFDIAIETGQPEPYGRNCQFVYAMMTKPMQAADRLMRDGDLPEDKEARLAVMKSLLEQSVTETNEKMIGILTPEQLRTRRLVAALVLLGIVIGFGFVFHRIVHAFSPPSGDDSNRGWGLRKYVVAYGILFPAAVLILFWQYIPLALGSVMAFQDYQIMGGSEWVGLDNFAQILWDREWWVAIWNSVRYSVLVIALTFLPPIILAIFLQEVPYLSIIFRTIFYLPAVITGLVVIYLWKSFYEGSDSGVLNALMMQVPAIGYLAVGAGLAAIAYFFGRRLLQHQRYPAGIGMLVVGLILFAACYGLARPIFAQEGVSFFAALFQRMPEPYEWLNDPDTAMIACILPMVWAGMGPGCLIYLAALKGIPDDLYEAADIDGATFIDKILFVVFPTLKMLIIINFIGAFIGSWMQAGANILAMTGGGAGTTVAGLEIFYRAYLYLQFGPATAMAWMLGFLMIGFTVHQLRILSRVEFRAQGAT
jgi:multiple sugar transport system permease protein